LPRNANGNSGKAILHHVATGGEMMSFSGAMGGVQPSAAMKSQKESLF